VFWIGRHNERLFLEALLLKEGRNAVSLIFGNFRHQLID
jgi:hypothetical protein